MALRSAIPEVAAAIPANWFGRSLADTEYQRQLQDSIATLRLEHGEKIDEFIASRTGPSTSRQNL
jgi:hypothetical protein